MTAELYLMEGRQEQLSHNSNYRNGTCFQLLIAYYTVS